MKFEEAIRLLRKGYYIRDTTWKPGEVLKLYYPTLLLNSKQTLNLEDMLNSNTWEAIHPDEFIFETES
jgi:hypothetical protein